MILRSNKSNRIILFAIVLTGFAIRMAFSHRSLFEDEFFSVYWVKRGLAYIWGPGLASEANPPLYYTIMFFWTQLFGFSEVALRVPTLLASVATIPIVYAIGERIFEKRIGLVAAALFAINPVQIGWADQARSYGFQTFLAALCMFAIILFFLITWKA